MRKNRETPAQFLSRHPGLDEALRTNHYIVRDIYESFQEFGRLSDKQVALVMKLAAEAKDRAAEHAAERHVHAPLGRATFQGTVVAKKLHEGPWGAAWKLTVKVETPEGSWLAWGTQTAAMGVVEKGDVVEIAATLEPGRDAHFAFMKRPRGRVVEPAAPATLKDEVPAGYVAMGVEPAAEREPRFAYESGVAA